MEKKNVYTVYWNIDQPGKGVRKFAESFDNREDRDKLVTELAKLPNAEVYRTTDMEHLS